MKWQLAESIVEGSISAGIVWVGMFTAQPCGPVFAKIMEPGSLIAYGIASLVLCSFLVIMRFIQQKLDQLLWPVWVASGACVVCLAVFVAVCDMGYFSSCAP